MPGSDGPSHDEFDFDRMTVFQTLFGDYLDRTAGRKGPLIMKGAQASCCGGIQVFEMICHQVQVEVGGWAWAVAG